MEEQPAATSARPMEIKQRERNMVQTMQRIAAQVKRTKTLVFILPELPTLLLFWASLIIHWILHRQVE
jgi:hypothetical protein